MFLWLILGGLVWGAVSGRAESRFPQPDFESGYAHPVDQHPTPRAAASDIADTVTLAAALALAVWLSLKRRSRRALFLLMLFCLLYFGFWKQGCICPIGAIQNVTLGLFDPGYATPWVAVVFFALPLLTACFFGRAFCAAVCPLGAIQDAVVFRPVRVPTALERALSMLPYAYLGLAVLYVVNGMGFLICRYDPFVGFFRMSGDGGVLLFGGALLLIGLFVARPYCRFLCPYGVLLGALSRLAPRRVTITPDECIQCRLCEDACPFGAIRPPAEPPANGVARGVSRSRLARAMWLIPLLALAGAGLGRLLEGPLARSDFSLRLMEQLHAEASGAAPSTLESDAFRTHGGSMDTLATMARTRRAELARSGAWFGAFLGLILALRLAAAALQRKRVDYEPDRGACLSCGRCFAYCPREQLRQPPEKRGPFHDF